MRCDASAFEAAGSRRPRRRRGLRLFDDEHDDITTLDLDDARRRRCAHCVDDDGDGLVDFADPDCCAEAAATSLTGRLTPAASATKVRLALAFLDPGIVAADPVTQAVVVELHGEGFDYCARVPAGRFVARKKGKLFTFKDRSGAVAAGLDTIVLKRTARGFKATIAGRRAAFATPPAGQLAVVLAFDGDGPDHCARCSPPRRRVGRGHTHPLAAARRAPSTSGARDRTSSFKSWCRSSPDQDVSKNVSISSVSSSPMRPNGGSPAGRKRLPTRKSFDATRATSTRGIVSPNFRSIASMNTFAMRACPVRVGWMPSRLKRPPR
jgi:hypothetical protein